MAGKYRSQHRPKKARSANKQAQTAATAALGSATARMRWCGGRFRRAATHRRRRRRGRR
jgi:hypothetical protein